MALLFFMLLTILLFTFIFWAYGKLTEAVYGERESAFDRLDKTAQQYGAFIYNQNYAPRDDLQPRGETHRQETQIYRDRQQRRSSDVPDTSNLASFQDAPDDAHSSLGDLLNDVEKKKGQQ